jgi:hypothetical protein
MWTGPLKCWKVEVRNSTHVSYLLTAASVNAGRLKGSRRVIPSDPATESPDLRLRHFTGRQAELG